MGNKCLDYEVSLLRNDNNDFVLGDQVTAPHQAQATEVLSLLLKGQYEKVLQTELAQQMLRCDEPDQQGDAFRPVDVQLLHNVTALMQDSTEEDCTLRELAVLSVGVACLQLFVQNNWVGPVTSASDNLFLSGTVPKNEVIHELLSVDSEPVYPLTQAPVYLLLARLILLDCRQHLTHCLSADWWLLRCLQTHQALLDERSPTLKATVEQLVETISTKETLMTDSKYRQLAVQFHLEAAHLMYFYYEPAKAREHFAQARKLSDLNVGLTGALGKRTRFQHSDLPQLVLKVERLSTAAECSSLGKTPETPSETQAVVMPPVLPKDLALDDDTVMNEIKFKDPEETKSGSLSPVEQALVLGLSYENRKTQEGHTDILAEESMAYINGVLHQPQNWCVQSTALLMRSRWESDSSRRLERSLAQLEELLTQFSRDVPEGSSRIHLLHCSQLPPKWVVEKELGELFVKLGTMKAALEVFERLQLWEEVIKCYQHLGRTEQAEKLIREQLAVKETPSLWCYLGDVLHDEECYHKAWELSNCRYARAQRALGYLYLTKGQFEKVLPCFEKSLKINALQIGVWFSYGCASLACNQYEAAAKAFYRCVTIHTDNFEAWSNLATAYVRSDQKPRAFLALQEAIKCEYENWKVWENYLMVSTDIGQFEEVIKAFHRLLEIKGKYSDSEVLSILVRAVNENLENATGGPSAPLRPKLQELFGRITSKVTTDADVWRLYAELLSGASEVTQTDRERALQYLQKSHRCATQAVNWQRDVGNCQKVAAQTVLLAKAYLQCSEKMAEATQAVQLLSAGRLLVKGVLAKIKQQHLDPATQVMLPELSEPCSSLDSKLQELTDAITRTTQS